jgi:hypothetical protein
MAPAIRKVNTFLGPDARSFRYAVIGRQGKLAAPFRSWILGRVLFELEAMAAK